MPMYVITVVFKVIPSHADEFAIAMIENARASLETEPGCHQFDVGFAPDDPATCFLYELYTDKSAFETHLAAAHFKSFDAKVAPWLESKAVQAYERAWPKD